MTVRVPRAVRGLAVVAALATAGPAVLAAQVGWSASDSSYRHGAELALGLTQQGDSVYRLAQERLNRGDYRAAATLFAQVAERNPRSSVAPRALYFRAFALSRTGNQSDLRDALRTIDDLERRFPDRARESDAGSLRLRVCGELARRGDADCAQQVASAAAPQGGSTQQQPSCPDPDDDNDERIIALNALLHMNAEQAMPLLERVLARRDACSVGLRRKAVFLVAQKRTDRTADVLLRAAREDPDAEVREQAVFWLGQSRDPRAVGLLAEMARNASDPAVQEKALFSLSQMRVPEATQVLRDVAQNEQASSEARQKAIFWLGQRRDAEARAFLRTLYGRVTNDELKKQILFALSQQRDEETNQWIVSIALNEQESLEARKQALFWAGQQRALTVPELSSVYDRVRDEEMKKQVLFVLSQRSDSAAVDKLMDIARTDTTTELRKTAIFWLSQKRDPRVLRFLEEIINK